jgi:hypothetical protein
MRIIESSAWALRTARFSLRNPKSGIRITLFPMVHVGEAAFFETVFADAFSHDVVLVEGVRSPIVRRITRSYRWVKGSKTMNLVIQPPHPPQDICLARVVHADLSNEAFAQVWLKIPLWVRALTYVASAMIGLGRRWFGSRATLAKGLSMDDLADRTEILSFSPETAALNDAVLHARDACLIERLGEQLDDPATGMQRLAIVYGAHHMRAVLRELTSRRGYRVERGDWLTVFVI